MSASLLVFGIVLPWLIAALVVVVGAWIGFQLIQQNGRLLGRLETLEHRIGELGVGAAPAPSGPVEPAPSLPAGLALGSVAPEFELPELSGGRRALSQFRGQRVLLVFFNPRCGFCTRMAPDLASLPVDGKEGMPIPLVVTTGDAEENRKLFAEHGVQCPVLLQQGMETGSQYQCNGTPMGYLIDEQGRIASAQAVGAEALLALREGAPTPIPANGNGHAALGGTRTLAESKIQRDGLAAGTPAPRFTLPRLEGGELALEEFRGQKVLLVFSDPNCGPCMALTPQLEQAHRRSADVQVLMVSRGDIEANREKVQEYGLTFPVALQKQWEVSREYATFATPAAYLIDEAGVLASDVAVGAESILGLLSSAALPTNGQAAVKRCRCGQPFGQCECGKQKATAAATRRRGRSPAASS